MGEPIVTNGCTVSDVSRTPKERTAIVRMIDGLLPIYNPGSIEKVWKRLLITPEGRTYILIPQRFKDLVKIHKLFAQIIGYFDLGLLMQSV